MRKPGLCRHFEAPSSAEKVPEVRESRTSSARDASTWMLVTNAGDLLSAVAADALPATGRTVLWTDDHSDLLTVLK